MQKVLTSIVEMMNDLISDNESPLYFDGKLPPIQTDTPHGIKRVFFGDPQNIGKSDFPAISVRPVNTRVTQEGTRKDMRESTVEIVIIENLRNYSDENPNEPHKVQSLSVMMDMMEIADENQQVSAKCILGKLLKNPRLPYTDSGTKYAAIATRLDSIDYVFNISRGFPTFEVIASFRVTSQGDRA